MSAVATLLILTAAALMEAGGDALVRTGLGGGTLPRRAWFIVVGGLVLTAYGLLVNAPPWDFGRLLGIYVALFFVIAQIINLVVFGAAPDRPVLVGGALVIAGGLLMTFWRAP